MSLAGSHGRLGEQSGEEEVEREARRVGESAGQPPPTSSSSLTSTDRDKQDSMSRYDPHLQPSSQPHSSPNGTASSTGLSYSSTPSQPPQLVARPDAKVKLTCVGDGGVGKVHPLLSTPSSASFNFRSTRSSECTTSTVQNLLTLSTPPQTCLLIVYSQKRFPTVRLCPLFALSSRRRLLATAASPRMGR